MTETARDVSGVLGHLMRAAHVSQGGGDADAMPGAPAPASETSGVADRLPGPAPSPKPTRKRKKTS